MKTHTQQKEKKDMPGAQRDKLLDWVDSDLYHLLDDAARLRLDDARDEIEYADQRFWTAIFESVRPLADVKPDLSNPTFSDG